MPHFLVIVDGDRYEAEAESLEGAVHLTLARIAPHVWIDLIRRIDVYVLAGTGPIRVDVAAVLREWR